MKKINFKNYIGKLFAFTLVFIFSFVVLTLPALATTEYMSFNLWYRYRNAIKIGMEYYYPDTGHNYTFQYAYTNDNTVTVKDNVTTINSNVPIAPSPSFPLNSNSNASYINRITISTPTEAVEPVFYVSESYLNKPITFSFQLTLTALNCEFWKSHGNNSPHMVLYLGSKDSYTQKVGTTSNSTWRLDSSTLYYKFDCTYTFTKTDFICGFWFSIYDPSEIGIYLNGTPSQPEFNVSYTLSPLVFSNDITEEDISNSVESALNGVIGGDKYDSPDNSSMDAYFDKENAIFDGLGELNKKFTVPDILDVLNSNLDLKHALIHFSNIIEDFRLNMPFINVLLLFSMGLGSIGFVFGLVQTIIRSRRK